MLHLDRTQTSRYCGYCDRRVLAEQQALPMLHFFALVASCGLWLPVLLWKAVRPVYRCRFCGGCV